MYIQIIHEFDGSFCHAISTYNISACFYHCNVLNLYHNQTLSSLVLIGCEGTNLAWVGSSTSISQTNTRPTWFPWARIWNVQKRWLFLLTCMPNYCWLFYKLKSISVLTTHIAWRTRVRIVLPLRHWATSIEGHLLLVVEGEAHEPDFTLSELKLVDDGDGGVCLL